ncbi:MAG TPA: hypothetical protein VND94_18730 [Terriglobia bacterium]|nr:hypothetical protein [Terriglobia bacterium]
MPELRCRIPERLIDFTPLLGVGLRHLVALGGLGAVVDKEPVKQVRIKYSMEDQVILDQLMTEFAAKQPRVIIAALECASRCRLDPIQESARPKTAA